MNHYMKCVTRLNPPTPTPANQHGFAIKISSAYERLYLFSMEPFHNAFGQLAFHLHGHAWLASRFLFLSRSISVQSKAAVGAQNNEHAGGKNVSSVTLQRQQCILEKAHNLGR